MCTFGCAPKGPQHPGGYRIKFLSDSGIRRHLFSKHEGRTVCERRFPDGGRYKEIRKLLPGSYSLYRLECSVKELNPKTQRKTESRRHRMEEQKVRKLRERALVSLPPAPSASTSAEPAARPLPVRVSSRSTPPRHDDRWRASRSREGRRRVVQHVRWSDRMSPTAPVPSPAHVPVMDMPLASQPVVFK